MCFVALVLCLSDSFRLTSRFFFFFKQKTAYEMLRSLVGSEMCIRDRYKKVPVVLLHDAGNTRQLNDSGAIIDELTQKLLAAGKFRGAESDTSKWSEWVDTKLVQALTVSIYRTPEESLQAMSYITAHPELSWQLVTKYVSAGLMYTISKMKLKKKYGITDERANLYQVLEEWAGAVGERKYLGGDLPSRADIEVFGMVRAIQGMDTFDDLQKNTSITRWYHDMQAVVEQHRDFE
eukprot:TRINITY_DN8504_c0_g1_i6.p1 TRINITY_DN8504_c0_g1~~TRINITY_DN8504_c0_g1_i6.p1  ORF type:complete len:235 (+),score=74.68 TRINITY_DN8504_c0_g1_i6:74-778(+)